MQLTEDIQHWRRARHAELAGADSWLGLVGLFWLDTVVNKVGSGEDCPVRLPARPAHLGDLCCKDGEVLWQPVAGVAQSLQTDRNGAPTAVDHENLSFFIVDRDGRLAARVRDRAWATRITFAGLEYFPASPEWIICADWQDCVPRDMLVPNVSGELKTVSVAQQAVFTVDGQKVELLPMSVSADEVFFVFRDRSSGKETYGAGRFLKAAPPVDGKITLDFNRACNPPCAFTPFATCPLPPPENWLPFAVPAGELRWSPAAAASPL